MIHIFLLVFGFYWVGVGILCCGMLIFQSAKAQRGIWLITIPAILVIGLLTINFVCHMLHISNGVIPYQKQIVNAINRGLQIVTVPLVLMKLYEIWAKRRAKAVPRPKDALHSD